MIHNELFASGVSRVGTDIKLEMEWSSKIVDKIDNILKERGMSQRELAKLVGCNETQIVRWTRGFPNLTLSSIAKLSVALGENLIDVGACHSSELVSGYRSSFARCANYLSDSSK